MSELEQFICMVIISTIIITTMLGSPFDPEEIVNIRIKGVSTPVFKQSYLQLIKLRHSAPELDAIPLQSVREVAKQSASQFHQRTGKRVIFVGFTDEELRFYLIGLKVFESELANLPTTHIVCGHGEGDGRTPDKWFVGGKSTTQWLVELGLKEAWFCACESPRVYRLCGTFHGRRVKR